MRPLPVIFLLILIFMMCGLCVWQWSRETDLRKIAVEQRDELQNLKAKRDEIEARVKAADADVLRLTGALTDLEKSSVGRQEHEDMVQQSKKMSDAIAKQNALIKDQNEAIAKANTGIQQANETIKKLAAERDTLAKQLGDAGQRASAPPSSPAVSNPPASKPPTSKPPTSKPPTSKSSTSKSPAKKPATKKR